MDAKEGDDAGSVSRRRDLLLKFQQRIEKAEKSGSSASTLAELKSISQELKQLVKTITPVSQHPSKAVKSQIGDELDKVFAAEEVGKSCDLCQIDLAADPERPGGSLRSLQEACVLACGHVYHFKCLRGTTLDLDNRSTNPSCIFCISSSY